MSKKNKASNLIHLNFLALVSIVFLFYFRAIYAFQIYSNQDDLCFLKWISVWLTLPLEGCMVNAYGPGSAIVWFPVSALVYLFQNFFYFPYWEALVPILGVYGFLLWAVSFLLNYQYFQKKWSYGENSNILITSFFAISSVPVLYYVTNRVTLAHGVEFFLASLILWSSLKKNWLLVFGASFLISITRYNDVFVLLFSAAIFYEDKKSFLKTLTVTKNNWFMYFIFLIFFVPLLSWFTWFAFIGGYYGLNFFSIFETITVTQVKRVLWGTDWGIIFSHPVWFFTLIIGSAFFNRISLPSKAILIWMWFNLIILFSWYANGGDFGYRYLIGNYPFCFYVIIELSKFHFSSIKVSLKRFFGCLFIFNGSAMLYLTWIYKTRPEVSLSLINNYAWENMDFLKNSVLFALSPMNIIRPLGLTPLGTILISIFDSESKYALGGWEFVFLLSVTFIAVCILCKYIYQRIIGIK